MEELETDFCQAIDDMDGEEMIQLKKDMSPKNEQINRIARNYESIFQTPMQTPKTIEQVKDVGARYEHLIKSKSSFMEKLNTAIIKQDAYKEKLFNESKLNIRLKRFSGYNDVTDFYTFKSDFNKLHGRTTIRYLLPDLLKNNYLKEPASSTVKSLTNIDEIWKQLKFAYGDVKILLTKKLDKISTTDSLLRSKDPELLSHAITKIINLAKELTMLAEKHDIEHHLYYSDAIQRLYNLLDDPRLSKWLGQITDQELTPKQTWMKFVNFLDKEQRMLQQKIIILGSRQLATPKHGETSKQPKHPDSSKTNRSQRYGHSYNNSSLSIPSVPICFVCNSSDGEN